MLKFAIKMEGEIISQIESLEKTANSELAGIFTVILAFERAFLELLQQADKVNIDQESYPQIDDLKILGKDNALAAAMVGKRADILQTACTLWMMYALVEKSAQYYHQASGNSPHPLTKIFFRSLGEIKNIFRGRLAACVRMTSNEIWEENGFAPFILGKE